MIINIIIAVVGWALTAWTVGYGCIRVPPGSFTRWLIFLGGAIAMTQFGWLPLLPFFGLRVTVADQYMAVVLGTVGLKVLMERALPWLVWSVEVDEVSE